LSKHVLKQKFKPKYAKKCVVFVKNSPSAGAPPPEPLASRGTGKSSVTGDPLKAWSYTGKE